MKRLKDEKREREREREREIIEWNEWKECIKNEGMWKD